MSGKPPKSPTVKPVQTAVDEEISKKLQEAFGKIQAMVSYGSLKTHLTQEVFVELKAKKTKFGGTLLDCIKSGIDNPNANGVFSCDADAYDSFHPLIGKVISDAFGRRDPSKTFVHDFGSGKLAQFPKLDLEGNYVKQIFMSGRRNLKDIRFTPSMTKADFEQVEALITNVLAGLSETDTKGNYYRFKGLSDDDKNKLKADHHLFDDTDRILKAAGITNHWPNGRGVFVSNAKRLIIWVNQEEHLRVICSQLDGDLANCYSRLIRVLNCIEQRVPYANHSTYGYLMARISNVGSGLRFTVRVRLPKLSKSAQFISILQGLRLSQRESQQGSVADGDVDVTVKPTADQTAYQNFQLLYEGVKELINKEKSAK